MGDMLTFMKKECALRDSVQENFTLAMASASGKEQLLKQMANAVEIISGNKDKSDERLAREKAKLEELSDKHLAMVEKERQYFKCIRDYEKEINNNETYTARLERIQPG